MSRSSDDNWTIAVPHAGAAGEESVLVGDIGVSVHRNRGNVQLASHCPFVQGLNVFQAVFETVSAQVYLVLRNRVKHEGVVRIGRVSQRENFRGAPHRRMLTAAAPGATSAEF